MTSDPVAPGVAADTVSVLVRSMVRDTLQRALASVATQRAVDVEVIVVNASGRPHPPLGNRCGPFELTLHEPGRALDRAAAANAALALARGRWAIFLDDDDGIDPDHLQRLRSALEADPGAGAAYGGVRLLSGDGQPCGTLDEPFDLVRLHCENFMPIHAVLFDRLAAGAGPWFDESLTVYEDWDFWLRLAQHQRFVHVPGLSATYHVEGQSGLTRDPDAQVTRAGRLAIYSKWAPRLAGPMLEALATRASVGRAKVLALDAERLRLDQALTERTGHLQQRERELDAARDQVRALREREDRSTAQQAEAQQFLHAAQSQVHEAQTQLHDAQTQLRDAQRRLNDARVDLDEERTRLHATRAALHRAQAAQRATQAELEQACARTSALQEAQTRHERSEADARLRAQKLQAELSSAIHDYRHLEAGYVRVTSSLSWRITAPLRVLRQAATPARWHAAARRTVRSVVRALPVAAETKQRIKVWMVARPWAARWLPWLALSSSVAIAPPPAAAPASPPTPNPEAPMPAAGATDKEAVRAAAERELGLFLQGGQRIDLTPGTATPQVSVVVVLFNQAGLSLLCLRSLMASRGVAFETLIVDNASSDRMPELLGRVDGATVLRQASNLGFLRAVNLAAGQARGEHLLLLNNDAMVEPDTLSLAVQRLAREPDAGAVGGPILLWDGRLQEAGSIIWRDGSCLGYGRGDDPAAPAYRFVRDVDYCSGAFLMVRRALFEQLGRFDEVFAPAYYEESDFCVRLWEHGHRIVYDPAVRVHHFEFASDEGSGRALELQTRNRARFVGRHPAFLTLRPTPAPAHVLLARQRLRPGARRVLMIDDRVPLPWLGQGYPRAASMVRCIAEGGHFVTHYPLQFPHEPVASIARALPERVEVMVGLGLAGLAGFLAGRRGFYDVVVVSRPHNMEVLKAVTKPHPEWLGDARIVYDAEALFSLRDIAKAAVFGQAFDAAERQRRIDAEMALARGAHAILTVSRLEAGHYRDAGYDEVHVLGHEMTAVPTAAGFAARSGFLFVGAMPEDDTPNVDSLSWFVGEVWPRVCERLGAAAVLNVVGHCEAPAVRAMAGPSIVVHGAASDLGPHFDSARVFVVPTRYAAGIAHKAHEAAAHGLPMVTSSLIASQLGWEAVVAVGHDAPSFADACVALHSDEQRWQEAREIGLAAVQRDCAPAGFRAAVLRVVQGQAPEPGPGDPEATTVSPATEPERRPRMASQRCGTPLAS